MTIEDTKTPDRAQASCAPAIPPEAFEVADDDDWDEKRRLHPATWEVPSRKMS